MDEFRIFQQKLTQRLLTWAGISLSLGIAMTLKKDRRVQGIGSQFAGWAVVNALIALFSARAAHAKHQKLVDGGVIEFETIPAEARGLRRILWVNAGLDVFYILGGLVLRQTKGSDDARLLGIGEGIAVQGVALLVFDTLHALLVPPVD